MRGRNHARVRNDDDANARERSREAPNEASQPPADASVARRAPSNTPPSHRIAKVTPRNERVFTETLMWNSFSLHYATANDHDAERAMTSRARARPSKQSTSSASRAAVVARVFRVVASSLNTRWRDVIHANVNATNDAHERERCAR